MKIGLFFGSFNPIHIGHLIIADQILDASELERIWMVISPQNPFKKKKNLLDQYDRKHLVELSTEEHPGIFPSDFEFHLPVPSYTIDSLTYLEEKYPNDVFYLIMGSDNLKSFHKWKNYELILKKYKILVYQRPGYNKELELAEHPAIQILEFPQMDISSTYIRNKIKDNNSIKYYLHPKVERYIKEMNFYK